MVNVNGTDGGQILYPKNQAAGVASLALADNRFEFLMLQYDGSGNFRVLQASPATAQAIGMAGTGGIDRWLFPAVSAYIAKLGDNGAAVSSFNSPPAYMTVTLPSIGAITAGWTIARRERQQQIHLGAGGWRRR